MFKLCVITTTRAEYGLLKNIISLINTHSELELCLVVTGTHLSPEFGYTISEIESDGFPISEKIDILLSSDSAASISKSMGLAAISFADMYVRQKPDLVIILGDRYELLPICSCAMNERIPIAHISGGETTEGAIDDMVRHCITKLSYLHFVACDAYRKRVIQLGESPDRVFNFGDVGVENINKLKLLSKAELEKSINFSLDLPYACVTFHPVTLEHNTSISQTTELLSALSKYDDMIFIITKANADTNGRIINTMIDEFVQTHNNCISFTSLGILRYLSSLKYSTMIIGNSSSGIVEAPSFGIPTVNIGDRQKGRLQATSIINCSPTCKSITDAMQLARSDAFIHEARNTINPYGSGDTSIHIIDTIHDFLQNGKILIKKKFYDINYNIKQ